MPQTETQIAAAFLLQGSVQGVGVRPAIARLALELGLCGFVSNQLGGVEIHLEGEPSQVEAFAARLDSSLPPAANAGRIQRTLAKPLGLQRFEIRKSSTNGAVATLVPRDLAVCEECRAEGVNPTDRRTAYPFTSCTNCGPRYSIIDRMPYERAQTSMSPFKLCPKCQAEFDGADDRRFHAQTNACPICGPAVWCDAPDVRGEEAIQTAAAALRTGRIVALKGIGGYQLLCDATDQAAVHRLRERKCRRTKPLPVMVDHPPSCRGAFPEALLSAANPIVLVPAKLVAGLAESVHPHLETVGVMLPTTPLHAFLLKQCDRPLVVTSGNIEGEPLAFCNAVASEQLQKLADLILHHDRQIVRPIDDSVIQTCGAHPTTIRAGRGIAPLPLSISTPHSILAVGGHQKSAVAISNGKQAVLGPHIGDLDSLATRERFVEQVKSLTDLYGSRPEFIVHDLHPDYFTTRWADEQQLPTIAVQHHHAHIASGMLEQDWLDRTVLGIAFDGTGYGTDDTIWGGEFLQATATDFQRVGHLLPFVLPGGELAVRQPWRVALSLLTITFGRSAAVDYLCGCTKHDELAVLARLIERRSAGPETTSAGRLFDGIAAMLLPLDDISFSGEPAMRLESVCDLEAAGQYALPVTEIAGMRTLDWRPLLREIVSEQRRDVPVGTIAMRFHRSLARAVADVARHFEHLPVVFSGGCFQNRLLRELICKEFSNSPQPSGLPGAIPPGDGGLAAGQLAIAAARLAAGRIEREALGCV